MNEYSSGNEMVSLSTSSKANVISETRATLLNNRRGLQVGVAPSSDIQVELDRYLASEAMAPSPLGHAFRILVAEPPPEEERIEALRVALENEHSGHAFALRRTIETIRWGVLPMAPTTAAQIRRRLKTLRQNADFSPQTIRYLLANETILDEIVADDEAQLREQNDAVKAEISLEERMSGQGGVYVFSYPHYLRHPTHPSSENEHYPDRTLMKIGFAGDDMLRRINEAASGAAVPEHRRILRAYLLELPEEDSIEDIEKRIHHLLDAAGHAGPKRASRKRILGGREWFVTSLEFLDAVAALLNVETLRYDEFADG